MILRNPIQYIRDSISSSVSEIVSPIDNTNGVMIYSISIGYGVLRGFFRIMYKETAPLLYIDPDARSVRGNNLVLVPKNTHLHFPKTAIMDQVVFVIYG